MSVSQFIPKEQRHSRTISTKNARMVLKLYLEFGGICQLCGLHVEPNEVSADHILPLARGGADELGNLQLAHGKCNAQKGGQTQDEWIRHLWRLERSKRSYKEVHRSNEQRIRKLLQMGKAMGITGKEFPDMPDIEATPFLHRTPKQIAKMDREDAAAFLVQWRQDMKARVEAVGKFEKSANLLEQAAYWRRLRGES